MAPGRGLSCESWSSSSSETPAPRSIATMRGTRARGHDTTGRTGRRATGRPVGRRAGRACRPLASVGGALSMLVVHASAGRTVRLRWGPLDGRGRPMTDHRTGPLAELAERSRADRLPPLLVAPGGDVRRPVAANHGGHEASTVAPECSWRSTPSSSWPSAPGNDELLDWAGPAALYGTDVGEQLGVLFDVEAERRRAVIGGAIEHLARPRRCGVCPARGASGSRRSEPDGRPQGSDVCRRSRAATRRSPVRPQLAPPRRVNRPPPAWASNDRAFS
jgi:hypothetical protein